MNKNDTMLLDKIQQKKEYIQTLCQQYGATHIRVFGSVARREENTESFSFPRSCVVTHMGIKYPLQTIIQNRRMNVRPKQQIEKSHYQGVGMHSHVGTWERVLEALLSDE